MNGEFWVGNEILHKLTDVEGNWTIRVDLTNENNATGYVEEAPFYIKPDDYTLSFGYSSTQRTGNDTFVYFTMVMEDCNHVGQIGKTLL